MHDIVRFTWNCLHSKVGKQGKPLDLSTARHCGIFVSVSFGVTTINYIFIHSQCIRTCAYIYIHKLFEATEAIWYADVDVAMLVSYCKLSLIHLHPEDTLIKIMCLGGSHVKVPVVMVIVVVKYDLGWTCFEIYYPLFVFVGVATCHDSLVPCPQGQRKHDRFFVDEVF